MESLRRREFLGMSLAATAVLGASEPKFNFPTEGRRRLAVSTYPFRKQMATARKVEDEPAKPGMTLEEFAKKILPELNVPGIEPWSPHFKSTEPEYVAGLRRVFDAAGIHVVNIPVDVGGARLCGSAEERQHGLAIYRKWVEAAVVLGSPGIRVHLPRGESGDQISCAVSVLKSLAAYGETKNIAINLENDDPENEQPERIVRVIQAVNSPYLRSLPDFCNSMIIHDDQRYNNRALSTLFPLAYNISHVKDSEKDDKKVYRVNMDEIFSIARKAKYRGYFSMEFEGEGDPLEGTRKLIEASLRSLG